MPRRRIVDASIALFLLSALIGTITAYNTRDAQLRFLMFGAAAVLYVGVSLLPPDRLWQAVKFTRMIVVGLAAVVILLRFWPGGAPDLRTLDFGRVFGRTGLGFDSGMLAGWIAALLPLVGAHQILVWRVRRQVRSFTLAAIGLGALALALGDSTSALLAILAILAIWAVVWSTGTTRPRSARLAAVVVPLGLGAIGSEAWLSAIHDRLDLAGQAWNLFGDFALSGAGLGSFPGLYSMYVRNVPVYFYGSSQNLYLDVAIDQGIVGVLALVVGLVSSFILLLASRRGVWSQVQGGGALRWATLSATLTVIALGLIDDAVYTGVGGIFLFIMPGMAVALDRPLLGVSDSDARLPLRPLAWIAGAVLVGGVGLAIVSWPGLPARWHANLGALRMARIDLSNWPRPVWLDLAEHPALDGAEEAFRVALALDPENRTAHHRLGLLGLRHLDFPAALGHLEHAYEADPDHRGVKKALGFLYAWQGDFESAEQVLVNIPEAVHELGWYAQWWRQRGMPQYAEYTRQFIDRLSAR